MTIFGTSGNDNLAGDNAGNTFDVSQGGNDIVSGLGGADLFLFGATLRGADEIHGGLGSDTVNLDGDYSFGVHFTATTMEGVETMTFGAGHNYRLILNNGNVAPGEILTVNGSALGVGDRLKFDGTSELDGIFHFTGGLGNDALKGGALADTFNLSLGGADTAKGGGGNDTFTFVDAFRASDRVDGGTGFNTVALAGDYSFGVHFDPLTIVNVQNLSLSGAHDYKIFLDDGNVAAATTLFVSVNAALGQSVFIDGSAETNGNLSFTGGASDDVLIGGAGTDFFSMGGLGTDFVKGGAGNDTVTMTNVSFTPADRIDGGSGTGDTLRLAGDFSGGFNLTSAQLVGIESLGLEAAFDYKFTCADGVVVAGQNLTVAAGAVSVGHSAIFNGSAELDGTFNFIGSAGGDTFVGGAQNDAFNGGLGADKLTGGGGPDTFIYSSAAASTGVDHDTIVGFDALSDEFSVFVAAVPTTVDAEIVVGQLRGPNFDADLGVAMAGLAAHHAVLFTPDSGNLAGRTFLVINADGATGYTSGADLVIEMKNMLNKASLDPTDF